MGWVEIRRGSVLSRTALLYRAAGIAALAAGLAACSSDLSRFNSNPFGTHAETTGAAAAPPPVIGRVETKPAYSSQPLPPPGAAASAGGHQPLSQSADVTGTVRGNMNWQLQGGTPVTVAQGETIESMALRYNVPGSAIMQANNLNERSLLRPGQQVIIPKVKYGSARNAPSSTAGTAKPMQTASASHVVAPGETIMSISRKYHVRVTDIVTANRLTYDARLRIGDTLTIPHTAAAVAPAKPPAKAALLKPNAPATVTATAPVPAAAKSPAPQKVASIEPTARLASPTVDPEPAASGHGGAPQFRWPVRGRVISGFGPIANGQQNDGINLSVPEGTAVRAADDGTVAYAGSELKGYGNLVLVRHSDGYVTAYAHASELMVKRGDTVRRGQVIAKSGQTGTVTAPQLHFEIRKGSTPVDPTKYLPGA
jgi:murein DD-endopeptidase MepM/ murein hydrolase activator NlpD